MKKILIPTDFSENASDALSYALGFLDGKPAEIHMLHVFNLPHTVQTLNYLGTPLGNAALDRATDNLSAIEVLIHEYAKKNSSEITVTTILVTGIYSTMIKKEAVRLDVDLIIMGTQGTSHSFIDKAFGTVSSGVIDNPPCQVMLIPKGYTYTGFANVIFPTALNHEEPYEINVALKLLQPHTVILHLLHIIENQEDKDEENLEKFASFISMHSQAIQTIFHVEVAKNMEQIISEYAERYEAEMIIMHKTHQSFWARLINGSHTDKMTSLLEVPLMVITS